MTDAFRRSTRQTAKAAAPLPTTINGKAKAERPIKSSRVSAPANTQLEHILKNPKSLLTTIDMSTLINKNTWEMLSPDSKACLATLLPPTAFKGFHASIEEEHPCRVGNDTPVATASDKPMDIDPNVDSAIFTSPHFLAAMHTYQDHLFSGWLTDAHTDTLQKFQDGIVSGKLAVAWKDENFVASEGVAEEPITSSKPSSKSNAATTRSLADLAKHGILQSGDILAYKRRWGDTVVEKDVFVQSVSPLSILILPGSARALPRYICMPASIEHTPPIQSADITDALSLERVIMQAVNPPEVAGKTAHTISNPNLDLASVDIERYICKAVVVWRWRDELAAFQAEDTDERMGRENHNTLFYLQGST